MTADRIPTCICDWVAAKQNGVADLREWARLHRERIVVSGFMSPAGMSLDDTGEWADHYERAAYRLEAALAAVDRRYAETSPVS